MVTATAPLLTVADVCTRTKLGKSKVFEFIASGELESLKLDGARRITEEQLADFIARRVAASKVPA
jgi:excisionase family DNA binding protein